MSNTLNLLIRINQFIKFEKTGTRQEFANKIGISSRQLGNYISYLRNDLGLNVKYCRFRQTYYYEGNKIVKIGKNS